MNKQISSGFNKLGRRLKVATLSSLASLMAAGMVQAEDWTAVAGQENLTALISGATAEIEVKEGVLVIGKYLADGTAKISAWGETFDRTWAVKGDDQVCYSSFTETECFTFEQDLEKPDDYRVSNVEDQEIIHFRITERGDSERTMVRLDAVEESGGMATPSAQDIAAELSNPNTNLGTMNFQIDHIEFDGDLPKAGSQSATRVTFQPSLPYKLNERSNLFVRPAIPLIVQQDVPNISGDYDTRKWEMGDISFDAAIGTALPGGIIAIAGIAGTLPTATHDDLGRDQWLLGPEAAVAVMRPWGVAGVLVSHQWDVAGEDDFDTSITAGQYFYSINMGNGWQFFGAPTFSYNHEARNSDNKLTLPLAVGVSKTLFISGRPWKLGAQYWHYLESPDDFGPDFQIRFSISPVVALPW
ncbi:hypothetical protein EYC98_21445 [Halieaceae bacterium IMCC14734]|uniref:Uncharacterized protein n=1 Tax=Candidatus Litorirhabdus singularis TaxID=2518993 RepID=A0ABT3TM77_9GAMM|nr:hypothetical protein [Candidatus Litorirhabdus singularis]MCX2983433.1 hypothetical protein [Candidatus Litorirhabdus singularis]